MANQMQSCERTNEQLAMDGWIKGGPHLDIPCIDKEPLSRSLWVGIGSRSLINPRGQQVHSVVRTAKVSPCPNELNQTPQVNGYANFLPLPVYVGGNILL